MVFWLDEAFDRAHSRSGHGRYGAAVRRRLADFEDAWGDIAPVGFAAAAWRVAMELEPAYVRTHPRVLSATCRRNAWDGTLTCETTMAGRWPAELTAGRQWMRDRGWRDWPQTFGQYLLPTDQDIVRAPHLRTVLLVEATIPPDDLPATPAGPDDEVEHAAHHAVAVIARELTGLLGPVLAQLDAGTPTDT